MKKLRLVFLIFVFTISLAMVFLSAFAYLQSPIQLKGEKKKIDEVAVTAKFVCSGGQEIMAEFHNGINGYVNIKLGDNRFFNLPQTISASGARYANTDESFIFWNKGNTVFIEENGKTTLSDCVMEALGEASQIANHASTNCKEKGGNLVIEEKADGSQYGLCYFDDARACEEWAMFRGECPVGGVKTTGYDTMAQKFCAWSGGKTQAVEAAVCTFPDGSTCLADDFYTGACQRRNNVN